MDDIIFEKDYRQKEDSEEDIRRAQILDRAITRGFFDTYKSAMDKIPKYIVPEDKANYEYLLDRCDKFVERYRGHIRGIVDYHKWHSEIVLTLPFAEFGDPEDRAFLAEIAEKSHSVTFEPSESGGIRVRVFICYFDELMSADHKAYEKYNAIMDDETLASLLGMKMLSPEMTETTQRLKEILDCFEEKTQYDRTTIFKALLARMQDVDEDKQNLETMVAFAEALLEKILNNETDSDTEE